MQAFIHLMQTLGYKIEYKGVCAGLTQMWVQAYFSGENEEFVFLQRIDQINSDFEKGIIDEKNIKEKVLQAREKVKNKTPLNNQDIHLLEMQAFFDGIALYQLAKNAGSDFFINSSVGKPLQTDVDIISKTAASNALKDNAIIKIYNEPLSCANTKLQNFFDEIKHAISDNAHDVVFTLSSGTHRIGIRFNTHEQKWVLINPGSHLDDSLAYKRDELGNAISLKETIDQNLKFDHEHIAKEVQAALSLESYSVININAFTIENNPKLETLKSSLLSLMPPRENVNNRGTTLIHLAVINDNINTLKDNISFFDLNSKSLDTQRTALEIALLDNHVECIKLLVKHGADLKLANAQDKTPLSSEIQEKKWENILAVLSSIDTLGRLNEKDLKHIKKKKKEIQKFLLNCINSIDNPSKKKQTIDDTLFDSSGLEIILDNDFKKKLYKLNAGYVVTSTENNAGEPSPSKNKSKRPAFLSALKLKSENKSAFVEKNASKNKSITPKSSKENKF